MHLRDLDALGQPLPENELVERARLGDREAFGELVRMHRAKALGWASDFAKDTYLAEDIVQDALIRAFLHLGTLTNSNHFKPWLKQIVRNQAYMRLRRRGPNGREQTFTGLVTSSASSPTWDDLDWRSIDSILFHLSKSVSEQAQSQEPSAIIIEMEIVDTIRTLLHCLSRKERDIFEAYFFRQLSIHEIANQFGTQKANIYNFLSRSRTKVQKERIRVYFRDYTNQRVKENLPTKKILAIPFDFRWS